MHTKAVRVLLAPSFLVLVYVASIPRINGSALEPTSFQPRRYWGNSDSKRLIFPNEKERYNVISKDVKREADEMGGGCFGDDIPLELALLLGNITNDEDLFNNLVEPDSIDQRIFSNKDFDERSAGEKPTPAGCNTQPTIVSLRPKDNNDPRLIYSPSCTRVNLCSGCCVASRLSCQPTSTRTRQFTVNVLEYVSGTKTRFKHRDIVPIEEHVGCACQCTVKEQDCSPLQKYNAHNCRCECANNEDRAKCQQQQDIKQWNPDTCLCECNEPKDCTSGSYFDQNQCKCLQYTYYNTN